MRYSSLSRASRDEILMTRSDKGTLFSSSIMQEWPYISLSWVSIIDKCINNIYFLPFPGTCENIAQKMKAFAEPPSSTAGRSIHKVVSLALPGGCFRSSILTAWTARCQARWKTSTRIPGNIKILEEYRPGINLERPSHVHRTNLRKRVILVWCPWRGSCSQGMSIECCSWGILDKCSL